MADGSTPAFRWLDHGFDRATSDYGIGPRELEVLDDQLSAHWKATGHPTKGGGTQDTDFNKGFTKGNLTDVLGNFRAKQLWSIA